AGNIADGKNPVVEKARSLFNLNDGKTQVIYLGNNVNEYGLPDESSKDYSEKKMILDAQVSLVQGTSAKAYFVPGNHDWNKGKDGGWEQVKNQQKYIESLLLPNVEMMPKNGCPGPLEVVVNEKAVIVFMDSQWWLEQADKPGIASECESQTEEEVVNSLREIISVNTGKLLIVAMHHPFYTHGTHGGYYTLKQHIFPFTDIKPGLFIPMPVIGSAYPLTRGLFGTPQDINHPKYRTLIHDVEEVLKEHPNVVHVSGHEQSLQFLKKDNINYIVSGSASNINRVKKAKYSLYAASEKGFAVLEITQSGKVAVNFYGESSEQIEKPLFTSNLNPIESKAKNEMATTIRQSSFPDSASAIGSDKFEASGLKKILIGKNYRKEWGEAVKARVFDIEKEQGGLKTIKKGGGHQTKSLRLEDKNGKEWVLRGIEKTVTDAALPPDLRGTFVKDIVQDGVSASYPYAALSVPVLAEAAGVVHAKPKLFFIPDDVRFERHRIDFANKLSLLEEREPGGFKKTINTPELAEKLKDDNDNQVDQSLFLRARLLDMFIMDFDRHEDQWRWGVDDKGKGNRYVALPRDRDQAFFTNQGFLSWVASWPWISPQVQGFRSKARNIRFYNFNARNLDRAYLNEMNEEDWKKGTASMMTAMTDEVIEKALAQQPDEIKKYAYGSIINKLKERKKYYPAEMMEYYRFISKIVNITGSDKKEFFDISRENDGSVMVSVYKINNEGEKSTLIYDRKFNPAITKELRLYGMGSDDQFNIHGNGSKIKIRIIGGKGEDNFTNNSNGGKTIAYDLDNGKNTFTGKFKMKLSENPEVNNYVQQYYQYNLWIPFLSFAFNRDDGLYLGASLKHIAHSFRKTPFAYSHQLAVNHSLATNAFNFRFNSEFIKAVGRLDLVLNADIKAPNNVTNFFGFGNESKSFIDTKPGKIDYYRTRYTQGDISMLLRKTGKTVSFSFGPAYQFYSLDTTDNDGRIIENPAESGLAIASVSQSKSWLGGLLNIGIDTRNSSALPTRGINWQTSFKVLNALKNTTGSVTQLSSDLSLFMSFSRNPKVVLATRFGGGINFGNNFEFFQAQYLGGTLNMRGFRKYRFAGKSMAYNNTELRIKIADFRTYLFPASIGLLFFHDIGRVWVDQDNSDKWHKGYGGGIYISPMRRTVIALSIAKSNEETLPVISFGFHF
ncbi:MAG TPA: BamA/TamA family outer membrane protein, partial [Chitinophagaceae bacterium]|nr:BamA/TamA family outer membrane protein [Chitinophagaceae bacterium]